MSLSILRTYCSPLRTCYVAKVSIFIHPLNKGYENTLGFPRKTLVSLHWHSSWKTPNTCRTSLSPSRLSLPFICPFISSKWHRIWARNLVPNLLIRGLYFGKLSTSSSNSLTCVSIKIRLVEETYFFGCKVLYQVCAKYFVSKWWEASWCKNHY